MARHSPPHTPGSPGPEEPPRAPATPEQLAVVVRLETLLEAAGAVAPPPFAYMRLSSRGRTRDLFLGAATHLDRGRAVIDWRTAPLAAAFFSYEDEYEIEIDGQSLTGEVLERYLLGFAGGRLSEIAGVAWRVSRREGDDWIGRPAPELAMTPRAAEVQRATPSSIRVPLDSEQTRAVAAAGDRDLLVLGEAGFGKTTVAIHRLARLHGAGGRDFRALVLVPSIGLRRLYHRLLDELEVTGVEVATFDEWIFGQARKLFPSLPARLSEDATAGVIRIKRHPALRLVLRQVAERETRAPGGRRRRAGHTSREDIHHLFGDRALLETVAAAAAGVITNRAIGQAIDHTKVQFSDPTELSHAHVDRERLVTIDGRVIDAGTPTADAATCDVEDCAALFEINRIRRGSDTTRAGRLARYDHIVLDEAQLYAPLELAVIGRARTTGGSFTIAGDEHQQIDDTACFEGWAATITELGISGHQTVVLTESYRSPPPIMRLARDLVAEKPVPVPAAASRQLLWARFDNQCHLVAHLIKTLQALTGDDPSATIAIICRHPRTAAPLAAALDHALTTRLALAGQFDFQPGVVVTTVAEVKGLEFDFVIIPDLDPASYPATGESRRRLYLAATRTRHQLLLTTTGSWSPLFA